jgi:multidrug efflux system membrane fusion protein
MDDPQRMQNALPPTALAPGELAENNPRPKSHRWRWIIAILIVTAIALAVVNGSRKSQADKAAQVEPPQITTIKVATAHLGPIGYYVEALGTVTPQATVTFTARSTVALWPFIM